jgi:hypothetical protein
LEGKRVDIVIHYQDIVKGYLSLEDVEVFYEEIL